MSTIVVTGGATGIGYAIAARLASDGHHVVLASRSQEKLDRSAAKITTAGGSCSTHALDVRDPEAVSALFDDLPEVDGLVNNAAGNFTCPTVDLSFNGFRAVVEISLYGTFLASQALARRLIREGRPGTMLNIVATYAWTGAPQVAHSAAAKAGMAAFTKSVAREWGPHGIRVNALAPGFVATEAAVQGILADQEAQDHMLDLIPLGRFAQPDDIADVAAFLMDDQSRYITGAVFAADGGRSLGVSMHRGAARTQASGSTEHGRTS
ncbi:SDR family oxidoreductase [Streptomyces sp. NPDC048479]|uniref:SDR family oxidoreductase n=1 Tax=Streptomyces sp. NPDC048479 TaxID=3154725 RepID=UPI00341F8F5D